MKRGANRFKILRVPVDPVTMDATLQRIAAMMGEPHLHQVVTVNPEFVMKAQEDVSFLQVLRAADLCLPDGIGLVWASRWMGRPLPERVPGSELVYRLAAQCAQEGWRLFLLGAAPGVADEAATRLRRLYPNLQIAGTYPGSPDPEEAEEIIGRINRSRPHVLYVAYGAPRQDLWIARHRDKLATVRLAIGVGGSLDFITGRAKRAPVWVQRLGLEWLHRLILEPWRWRRMLALPRFALAILKEGRPRAAG